MDKPTYWHSVTQSDSTKVKWVTDNAFPVKSIDPNNEDYTDLLPLQNIIKDTRVVMLGEATHGDGATFYAKQRLVRFLNEMMEFDVLAWEIDFFTMEEMNFELKSGQPILPESIWGESGVMKPIYQYSRATLDTNRLLIHTGFDIVPSFKLDHYFNVLFRFIEKHHPKFVSSPDLKVLGNFLNNRGDYNPTEEERTRLRIAISDIVDTLYNDAKKVQNNRDFIFFAKTLEDLADYEQHIILSRKMGFPPENIIFRGRKMGENLLWLVREWYPDKKIIVWAANRHVARNVLSIQLINPQTFNIALQFLDDYREMGDLVHSELGNSAYSIGFTSFRGSRGRKKDEPEQFISVSQSIENIWHLTGIPYGIIDFSNLPEDHWLCKPSFAYFDGTLERANWAEVFDGMFFIDTMFPNNDSSIQNE